MNVDPSTEPASQQRGPEPNNTIGWGPSPHSLAAHSGTLSRLKIKNT